MLAVNSNLYSLSIRFTSDGFSLYIYTDNKILISSKTIKTDLLKKSRTELMQILESTQELSFNYKSVQVIVETTQYTFIPHKLYDQESCKHFLNLQHPESLIHENIYSNYLKDWNLHIVFSIPDNLHNVLSRILPEIIIEHHIYAFINDKFINSHSQDVLVLNRSETFDIIVLNKGLVQFVNTFNYSTPETALYYILKVYDDLKLDIDQYKLHLNNIKQNSAFEELIKIYIKNLAVV